MKRKPPPRFSRSCRARLNAPAEQSIKKNRGIRSAIRPDKIRADRWYPTRPQDAACENALREAERLLFLGRKRNIDADLEAVVTIFDAGFGGDADGVESMHRVQNGVNDDAAVVDDAADMLRGSEQVML